MSAIVAVAAHLGGPLLRAWAATLRPVQSHGWDSVMPLLERGPLVLAFWHARLLMPTFAYPRERRVGVLISPSRDGDLIAAAIAALGRTPIRGSSRRGAVSGTLALSRALQRGWDIAVAVDGPTGPAYRVKPGVVHLAQHFGVPIVPVTYTTRAGRRLGSWDGFWLPRPFSALRYDWGPPLLLGPNDDAEAARAHLEATMRTQLAAAEAWAGRPAPWVDAGDAA